MTPVHLPLYLTQPYHVIKFVTDLDKGFTSAPFLLLGVEVYLRSNSQETVFGHKITFDLFSL